MCRTTSNIYSEEFSKYIGQEVELMWEDRQFRCTITDVDEGREIVEVDVNRTKNAYARQNWSISISYSDIPKYFPWFSLANEQQHKPCIVNFHKTLTVIFLAIIFLVLAMLVGRYLMLLLNSNICQEL